jgi:hypothetical protein
MYFEYGKDARAMQGAVVVLGLVRTALENYNTSSVALRLVEAIRAMPKWNRISTTDVRALRQAMTAFWPFTKSNIGDDASRLGFANRAIGSCISAMENDLRGDELRAWRNVASAAMAVGAAFIESEGHSKRVSGGLVRRSQDPKHAAKLETFKIWQQWRDGQLTFRSGAAFAKWIVEERFNGVLESQANVEAWLTAWRKGKYPVS